jgi:sugar/nucleoside kinase (ribokinase family)
MKDIVVIGDIMIDIVALIQEEIHRGSDTQSNTSMQFGGAAANVATWLGIEGHTPLLVGALGDDLFAHLFQQRFKQLSLSTSIFTSSLNTGSVIAISHPDQERSMLSELGANKDVSKAFHESQITPGSVVYVSGYVLFQPSNREFVETIIRCAKANEAILVLDPASAAPLRNSMSVTVMKWLTQFDYLLPNELEFETLLQLRYQPTATVFEKRGAEGVNIHINSATSHVAAQSLHVVDTVGAGDAFAAGVLIGLAQGLTDSECAKLGISLASKACQIRGATPGHLEIK